MVIDKIKKDPENGRDREIRDCSGVKKKVQLYGQRGVARSKERGTT